MKLKDIILLAFLITAFLLIYKKFFKESENQPPGNPRPQNTGEEQKPEENSSNQEEFTERHYVQYKSRSLQLDNSNNKFNFDLVKVLNQDLYIFRNSRLFKKLSSSESKNADVNEAELIVKENASFDEVTVLVEAVDDLKKPKIDPTDPSSPTLISTGGCVWRLWSDNNDQQNPQIIKTGPDYDLGFSYKHAIPMMAAKHFTKLIDPQTELPPIIVFFITNKDEHINLINNYLKAIPSLRAGFESNFYRTKTLSNGMVIHYVQYLKLYRWSSTGAVILNELKP